MSSQSHRPYYDPETFQWPAAVPAPYGVSDTSFDYFDDTTQAWMRGVGQPFARFYSRMVVSQPFEVAKFLLQVGRYGPLLLEPTNHIPEDDDETPVYFLDARDNRVGFGSNLGDSRSHSKPGTNSPESEYAVSKYGDQQLTLVPAAAKEFPEAVHPRGPYVTDMMVAISDKDGPFGLWRALHTSCLYEAAGGIIQSWLGGFLSAAVGMPDAGTLDLLQSADPSTALAIAAASGVVAQVILSPLALIRARLMVTALTAEPRSLRVSLLTVRSWPSFSTTFLTALAHGVSQVWRLVTPYILYTQFQVDSFHSPVKFQLGGLISGVLQLAVSLPLDTLAHRSQVAELHIDHSKLMVEPVPYSGFTTTFWNIFIGREPLAGLYRGWRTVVLGTVGEWGYRALDATKPAQEMF